MIKPRTKTRPGPEDIQRRISELGDWFHNIELAGVSTAPDHFLGDYPALQWRRVKPELPQDLSGATVLDIGCNAGFFSIEAKRMGADRVVGIDHDSRYLSQARLAAEMTETDIELHLMSVYDLGALGERFDIVMCMGVLYHLRHPLLALDIIHDSVVKDLFLFQSLERGSTETMNIAPDYPFGESAIFEDQRFPRLHFVEGKYAGDPTNWWIPNRACSEALLRSAGFEIVKRPAEEIYICRYRPTERAGG